MIAENAENAVARPDGVQDAPHARVDLITSSADIEAVVAGEDTQIDGKRGEGFGQDFGQSVDAVDMEIAQVEKAETLERGREVGKFQLQLPNEWPEGVGASTPIEAEGLQGGLDAPGENEFVLEDEVTVAMGTRTPVVECLNGTPFGQTRFEGAASGFQMSGLEQGGRVTIMVGRG